MLARLLDTLLPARRRERRLRIVQRLNFYVARYAPLLPPGAVLVMDREGFPTESTYRRVVRARLDRYCVRG